MRKFLTLAAMIVIVLGPLTAGDALAKSCRDTKGKFMKCAAVPASNHCRDIKTKKFSKCSAAGTEAIP
jgi:hypothetical protein